MYFFKKSILFLMTIFLVMPTSYPVIAASSPQVDNALHFDGVKDYVTIPDNDALITDAVTIETWVKWEPDSPTDVHFICGKGIEQMEIHTGPAPNKIRFIPTQQVYIDAEGVLPTGVWTHLAVVYQPSAALAKMYLNGKEIPVVNNGQNPLTHSLQSSTEAPFLLGKRIDNYYKFKGAMDNFRVWNRALTQNEICMNMLNSPSNQTGLIGSYDFNVGIAEGVNDGITGLPDQTGNFNGTLHEFTLNGSTSNWIGGARGNTNINAVLTLTQRQNTTPPAFDATATVSTVQSGKLVFALYEGSRLVSVSTRNLNLLSGQTGYEYTLPSGSYGNHSVRLYFWEDTQTLKPLAPSVQKTVLSN